LLLFWVASAGFGFLLAGLLGLWEEIYPSDRWFRAAELVLVGLVNAAGFWAVLRPASFWPQLSVNGSSGPKPTGQHRRQSGAEPGAAAGRPRE
jgi:hypothetical protein